jgi:hypothetical protein
MPNSSAKMLKPASLCSDKHKALSSTPASKKKDAYSTFQPNVHDKPNAHFTKTILYTG